MNPQVDMLDMLGVLDRPVGRGRYGKTRSTEEAMAVLKKYRAGLIEKGRAVARELCMEYGLVTSRDVREEMDRLGLLTNPEVGDYWLGAVFNCKDFSWTGGWKTYSDSSRNIHERTVKEWALA